MNTPRTAIVEISVPDFVTDQDFANALWRVIRRAIEPGTSGLSYPDPASLEVTVFGLPADRLAPQPQKDA